MKRAKRIPFAARRARRLNFSLIQRSTGSAPSEQDFARWISATLFHIKHTGEISLMLCDEGTARNYNRDYRGKDYATNVLSFVLDDTQDTFVCGDLLICPQVVAREAAEQHKDARAHYAHLTIHGTLHLAGFDHIEEGDAQTMEALEIAILNQLGYKNPYL